MIVARIFESALFDASADKVWAVVRDFSSPERWSAEILSSAMENDAPPDQVGGIRVMKFDFGASARERLTGLSEIDRRLDYELLPPEELPFKDYRGTMQVIPITQTGQSVMSWASSFGVAEGDLEATAEGLASTYQSGMASLAAMLKQQ